MISKPTRANMNVIDMLKVVSFDVVGTLVDFSYENYVWKEAIPQLYAKKRGISFEEAKNCVLREYDRIGDKDIRWYLPEYWFKHFNLDKEPADVFRTHMDKVQSYKEVETVLRKLSQEYDLIIASCATRSAIEIMIEKFRHYFKQVHSSVSDRQEVEKTPQFYEMVCRILKSEPCTIAHVGDEWYSDFISPRSIGIKSYYLDRTGEKRGRFSVRDLKEFESRLGISD